MSTPGECANCGVSLPPDQPAGLQYCGKCAAAWLRGNGSREQTGPAEDDVTLHISGRCDNCGASLPSDQPAGHQYCEKCAAAWLRGNAPSP
jgi:predicted RNA-binding Zn-ribbon protein involved in translation (DUF1610 family)